MPIAPDPITRRKLLLVKQLYQQAALQAASVQSTVNRILALIGFDLANETALKAVVSGLDASKTPSDAFQALVQQADALLGSAGLDPVPDKASIQHVHSLRNDAQHKAKYPNESDVTDCRTYSRDFLQKLVTQVWALDFDNVSIADLVDNEKAKQHLKDAETALDQHEYDKAVEQAAAGFTWALTGVRGATVGDLPVVGQQFVMNDWEGNPVDDDEGATAFSAFRDMHSGLLVLLMGLDFPGFMRYRHLVGTTGFLGGPRGRFIRFPDKKTFTRDEAEFVVPYCINAVMEIERRVGDIDRPFGLSPSEVRVL